MLVSIFNDVIGPVMRGPSSSHCAAALRIGRLARDLMGGEIADVLVEFDRGGSLPTTHESQGSDMGLFGGLLGWEAADDRLPASSEAVREAGIRVRIETVDAGDPHPNTYRLTLENPRERRVFHAISTGGGMIEGIRIDEFEVSLGGDAFVTLVWLDRGGAGAAQRLRSSDAGWEVSVHEAGGRQLVEIRGSAFAGDADILRCLGGEAAPRAIRRLRPVLPVLSYAGMAVPFGSAAEMLDHDAGRQTPLWKLAVEYEMARGRLTEAEVLERMTEIVRILRRSIGEGLRGTRYEDRILGHQSGRFEALRREGRLLDGGALNRVVAYVTAMMEVKSSMGVIVAAPTAGACAALPAAVIALAEERGMDEAAMARALLASGLVGVFIATRWTFAAEVGGCQAEGGAAASMAAAALVTLADGTLPQALAAASMALQSMIGLICDPVANRVEVPCLGKNVMAASNALSCANMALADFDAVIPLDEVIETAKRVAGQMPRELRCTALGGLATTPTSLALERRLAASRSGGCGTGCGVSSPVQVLVPEAPARRTAGCACGSGSLAGLLVGAALAVGSVLSIPADEIAVAPAAAERVAGLEGSWELRRLAGWEVRIARRLGERDSALLGRALEAIEAQLTEIAARVPAPALEALRGVPLWISPEYEGTPPRAEYHPDAGWLRRNGRDPVMARGVEFTNVRIFEAEARRMPMMVLHELAHAYHDRVLGFAEPRIVAAFERARASGSYESVERSRGDGRRTRERAYAMTDAKEYFAETTEAFFGRNDFQPFDRAELERMDPGMYRLLGEVWGRDSR